MSSDFCPKSSELDPDVLRVVQLWDYVSLDDEGWPRGRLPSAWATWVTHLPHPSRMQQSGSQLTTMCCLFTTEAISDVNLQAATSSDGQQDRKAAWGNSGLAAGRALGFVACPAGGTQEGLEEKLGYNSHEQNLLSDPEKLWSFIIPGLQGMNLVCFQYRKCYGYFSPKPLLSANKKKQVRQEAKSTEYKAKKPCSEHTLNKADTKYVKAKLNCSHFQ